MSNRSKLNLLPCPCALKILRGTFTLPKQKPLAAIKVVRTHSAPNHPEGYALAISKTGIEISFRETGGLRAATATLRQLLREYGRRLPCLRIRDWPDFSRRGVMLDVSRGRVPKLETLLDLAEKLSDFKINELQLYTEHTFAYRNYKSVWQSWGALTAKEIQTLDARCRELGIDLVPNQNSFGHLRYFLEHPKLKKLAEVSAPYEGGDAATGNQEFVRRPTTLAPNHPGTIPFLRGLYDELLPNFSSKFFNVGCDETWDLGRGQSKNLCEQFGKGKVYLDFLKKIHSEVSARDRTMMFWGDIILKYPKLISQLPKNVVALNWGYEANHPFEREAAQFAKAKIPFYVCPGTSTWQTLIGKHDNALANLRAAAKAGKKFRAIGYLVTDWGDGGHPQPLATSWPMFLAGASLAWNSKDFDESKLVPVLGRDVFEDPKIAKAAFELGFAHKKVGVNAPNETPIGTAIAAPKPEDRELFCRNGLKWFSKIPPKNIRAALIEIEKQIAISNHGAQRSARPTRPDILRREFDLAARMAAQSCQFMLWQQAANAGKVSEAKRLARTGIRELQKLERDFNSYWPLRNKATPKHCTPFLRWRIEDYRRGFAK
ncbi:MAG TPA: family 20 glycosylhydrolase [Methylomirabilota bacterium]|nr:family 20 glycosylhydrolase [Methylomirabilota bacterium]